MESDAAMAEAKERAPSPSGSPLAAKVAEKADRIKYFALALLAAFVVCAAIVIGIRNNDAARIAEANNAVFMTGIEAQGKPEAEIMSMFAKIARDYRGLPAAEQAIIYQFGFAFSTNDLAAAEKAARDFLAHYPSSSFAPNMRLALGQTLMNLGRHDEAKRELEPLRDGPAKTLTDARLALAQILEREAEAAAAGGDDAYQDRLEQAREAYTDIVTQSRYAGERPIFWPPRVVSFAEYALILINDRLAGYEHPEQIGRAHV